MNWLYFRLILMKTHRNFTNCCRKCQYLSRSTEYLQTCWKFPEVLWKWPELLSSFIFQFMFSMHSSPHTRTHIHHTQVGQHWTRLPHIGLHLGLVSMATGTCTTSAALQRPQRSFPRLQGERTDALASELTGNRLLFLFLMQASGVQRCKPFLNMSD